MGSCRQYIGRHEQTTENDPPIVGKHESHITVVFMGTEIGRARFQPFGKKRSAPLEAPCKRQKEKVQRLCRYCSAGFPPVTLGSGVIKIEKGIRVIEAKIELNIISATRTNYYSVCSFDSIQPTNLSMGLFSFIKKHDPDQTKGPSTENPPCPACCYLFYLPIHIASSPDQPLTP